MIKPRPIRVLFAHSNSDPYGGSDRSLFSLVTHLDRSRFDPLVLLPPGPMTERYGDAGVRVIEAPLAPLRKSFNPAHHVKFVARYRPTIQTIREIIKRGGINVVHVNTGVHVLAARAARLERVPIVWHVREIVGTNRVLTLAVKRWATRIVTNSEAVKETFGLEKAVTVYNGVDLSRFEGAETSIRVDFPELADRKFAVMVSRIDSWKGHRIFIDAARIVHERLPEVRFVVVGGAVYSRPELFDSLRQEVRDMGLSKVVLFSGARDDVPGILKESAFVVCPSTEPEPFGRVPIEAMAACKPVIASRAGGHLETIADHENGLLVPLRDSRGLAEGMLDLFKNPKRRESMGRKGRERVEKQFSLERCVRDMEDIFTEVCREVPEPIASTLSSV